MKAIFLYNPISGRGLSARALSYLKKRLSNLYETVDFFICQNVEQLRRHAISACGVYDVLIFAGGDGTFHHVINAIAPQEPRPILASFPCGTCNDAMKNFGYTKNIRHNLHLLEKGKIIDFDIFKCQEEYVAFSASIGAFSSIPYTVKTRNKKVLGRRAYYLQALKEMRKKEKVSGVIKTKEKDEITFNAPFLMILNSGYMGGFKVNRHSDMTDGKLEVMFTEKGWFNGLWRYFFRRRKIVIQAISSGEIQCQGSQFWDVDGERGPQGKITLSVLPKWLKIYTE